MDGVLFRSGPDRFWYVQPDGGLETWLLAHSAGFDVTISDPTPACSRSTGRPRRPSLRDASGGVLDTNLGYFRAGHFDIGGQPVYVSRTGWTAGLGYEL